MEPIFKFKSITGAVMNVYEDKVELTQEGARGLLTRGLQGVKTYYYTDISTIQFKNCGWTNGFFEFTFAGGIDRRGGAWNGFDNDNRINFGAPTIGRARKVAEEAEKINNYLQERLRIAKTQKAQPTVINQTTTTGADEILKYKQLLDDGIISEEEFQLKKKQILGI